MIKKTLFLLTIVLSSGNLYTSSSDSSSSSLDNEHPTSLFANNARLQWSTNQPLRSYDKDKRVPLGELSSQRRLVMMFITGIAFTMIAIPLKELSVFLYSHGFLKLHRVTSSIEATLELTAYRFIVCSAALMIISPLIY